MNGKTTSGILGMILCVPLMAQAAPVEKLPAHGGVRSVHPGIADPLTPGAASLNGTAPLFQYDDMIWNNGEGFVGATPEDSGGWFEHDDGTGVTAADVVTPFGWQSWNWLHPTHGLGVSPGASMKRLYGFLRPASLSTLPNQHPLYGDLTTAVQGPFAGLPSFGQHDYVDQAAFEVFRPNRLPAQGDKIVIVISTRETTKFPADKYGRQLNWRQTYMGFFSPDGLMRPEVLGSVRSATSFFANTADDTVIRPHPLIVAKDPAPSTYYPIFAYAVPSVMHRQAELNEQRDLQLLGAIKAILQEDPAAGRNPLPVALTPATIDKEAYVVFAGSSNGGMQAMFAAVRHPELVHGNFSDSMSASKQRLISELDMKHAVSRFSGGGKGGTESSEDDMLQWGQYAWNQGLWVHDLSMVQRYLRSELHRPSCFVVGDEDITGTGTDWISIITGSGWQNAGAATGLSPFGSNLLNRFAWSVGENACHGEFDADNPYSGPNYSHLYHTNEALHDLIIDVIGQHDALNGAALPALVSHPRLMNQELRGLDEPHEWALGRLGEPMTATAALIRDDQWFNDTQPGAAGTMLGYKEAMFIRDGYLFVGSTEGVVTKFEVNGTTKALDKVAHSNPGDKLTIPPFGSPMALGHEAFAMTAVESQGGWSLVVGTRRHLHRLDPSDLTVTQVQDIPWELSRPRHLKVGNVLPDSIHPGDEIIFCSPNGGLAFYATDFSPIWEWSEPGIVDFQIQGTDLAVLSQRGVVARVRIVPQTNPLIPAVYEARLLGASKPMPGMGEYETVSCQGYPVDLESMLLDWTAAGGGPNNALVAAWNGDGDGGAARAYITDDLLLVPYYGGLGNVTDLATTNQPAGYLGQDGVGDHLLVLSGNRVSLIDQFRTLRGVKDMHLREVNGNPTATPLDHAAGNHSHAMAVGELYDSGGNPQYSDEVVIATTSGALVWLHVEELLGTAGVGAGPDYPLPSPQFDPIIGSATQPRTNQNLSATWAVSRTNFDQNLHCLDRRGAYWKITPSGLVSFEANSNAVRDAKAWQDVGNRLGATPVKLEKGGAFILANTANLNVLGDNLLNIINTKPWAPINSAPVFYEGSSRWVQGNWFRDSAASGIFHGFAVHRAGGTVLALANGKKQAWYWSGRGVSAIGDWANLVEAYQMNLTNNKIDAYWASVGEYDGSGVTPCPHHDLRSLTAQVEVMNQQSIRAVELSGADVAVVLGCPGGRIRVITVAPGDMRVNESTYHQLGDIDSSDDLGYGGGGLAVRPGESDDITIWFGTIASPVRRPTNSSPTGALLNDEVATGAVHRVTWTPSGFGAVETLVLNPLIQGASRGGYGVVGLAVGNILGDSSSPDEIVVGTVGGDVLILDEGLDNVLWRANAPGGVGFYNSIFFEDLDPVDGVNELYISGSFGIWRFNP